MTVPLRLFSLCLVVLNLLAATSGARGKTFDLRADTFPFANETVFAYGVDEAGQLHIHRRDKPVQYGHRCFVLTRAVLQFHQFARFAPEQPKVSREEYRKRILRLFRIPVWSATQERVVIPGFRDLRSFTVAYEGLLKENLGNWLPSYFRVGNYRMAMGHPRAGQEAAARWLASEVEQGRIRAVYVSRFPHLNHALIAYRAKREPKGDLLFTLYDPNYPGEPTHLRYVAARRSFDFERRWYFPGGQVNLMRLYLSPWH